MNLRQLLTLPLVAFCCATATLADDSKVDFANDVVPILQRHCIGCHSQDDAEGGFAADTYEALMKGGETGVALTSGQPRSSRILLMVQGKLDPKMPPEGETELSETEIETLVNWIDQGAAGPTGKMPLTRELRTPRIAPNSDIAPPVTAMAISPNGQLAAVARFANLTLVRDGQSISKIGKLPGKINSLSFSSDGSTILVGTGLTGAYGYAAIYRVSDGTKLSEFTGHRDTLYCAVFSPDESKIATAGYDRNIIIWDSKTGKPLRELKGHNGAVFDLAFSPDGTVLVSGCADETAKIWHVETGQRLDTLSQPEGEVLAVDVSDDGKFVLAGSADNRIRVWKLVSKESPRINPIVATRFVDESPIVDFSFTNDGSQLVAISEAGNIKVLSSQNWNQVAELAPLPDLGTGVFVSADSNQVTVPLMNGETATRSLPISMTANRLPDEPKPTIFLDLGELTKHTEAELRQALAKTLPDPKLAVGRGAEISGVISLPGEVDEYRWQANAGEVWAIDADRTGKSNLDPMVSIVDESGQQVLRVRLQAIRDSYFTFRGKDSSQVGDFRIFNWQEMHLSQYLYANGEVTRLWMHPRGPDSGFNVYPGEGKRWTYFGTNHSAHALGEPAYVVEPLADGEKPVANGLPVFDIYYENDDDPMRRAGVNSRLLFTAPHDGLYTVRVKDTRSDGSPQHAYTLKIRPATPGYQASLAKPNATIRRGTGREFTVRVDRIDGFDGPVTFDIPDLPPQIKSNLPLTIEAGQRYATGTLWVAEDAEPWGVDIDPSVIAWAMVNDKRVERKVGTLGKLKLGDVPNVIPSIKPIDRDTAENEDWTLQVKRGETATARLVIRRKEGFNAEVSFGKETSGRNASQGVYVDNIGLNGLIVLKNTNERQFFLSADISAVPGKRSFFFRASVDGNVTSYPITVEVLP